MKSDCVALQVNACGTDDFITISSYHWYFDKRNAKNIWIFLQEETKNKNIIFKIVYILKIENVLFYFYSLTLYINSELLKKSINTPKTYTCNK